MRDVIAKLLRVHQWYKNIVIFLAIVFSGNLLDVSLLGKSVLGFFVLCLVSSSNYIINDIVDMEKDRLHPEKRFRPIASGRIKVKTALFIAFMLLSASLLTAYMLSFNFMLAAAALFLMTTAYTFFVKKIVFFDTLFIAVNFVIRAVAGALLIDVWISPFLVMVPFFFALFLASGKRYSDKVLMKKEPKSRILVYILFFLTLLSYILYCWFVHLHLFATLPFVLYALSRYLNLIFSGSAAARRTELIFKDKKLLFSVIGFVFLTTILIYLA